MTLLSTPVIDEAIKAICNTLVNSLWQGVILAAVAGLIVVFTKRSTSTLRYNLLTTALLLFTVGTVITFFTQFKTPQVASAMPIAHQTINNVGPQIIIQPFKGNVVVHPVGVLDILADYLNTYHNTIVLIWFLIICAKSIQFGTGLYGTFRLKRTQTAAIDGYWKERTYQLACLLAVDEVVDILESGLAKVPMVIGHLKPVILIPIGLVNALSTEEVEAILIHELAHIKRRDYLVNVLQSIAEIVFFFNPAVLWISQLIKAERENCCDDMVLEQNSSKVSYIRALVTCEEYQAAVPAYAMALPGSRNTLLERVKRLATNRNNSLNLFEKTFLAICLVISGLCISAFAAKDSIKHTIHEVVKTLQHSVVNKEEQQKLVVQTTLLQKQTTLVKMNTQLLSGRYADFDLPVDTTKKLRQSLNVNVAPMVNVQPSVFLPVFKGIMPQINISEDMNLAPLNVAVDLAAPNVQLAPMNVTVNPIVHLSTVNPSVNLSAVNPIVHLSGVNPSVHLAPMNINLSGLDTVRYNSSLYYSKYHQIAHELFKLKVIDDTTHFTFSMSDKELIVNGTKQPDAIHKAMFDKFGGKATFEAGEVYNNNGSYNYSSSPNANTYYNSTSVGTGRSSNPSSSSSSSSSSNSYGTNSNSTYSNATGSGKTYSNSYNSTYPNAVGSGSTYSGNTYAYSGTQPTPPTHPTPPGIAPTPRHYSSTAPDPNINKINEDHITGDLLKDDLIKDEDNINFKLTTKEFILNGKKQSDAVFEKYKKKYVPATANDNWTWSHSHSGSSASAPSTTVTNSANLPDELIKAHLITEKEKTTFSAHLDDKELVINGVKQPEATHQQILKKFKAQGGTVDMYYRYTTK